MPILRTAKLAVLSRDFGIFVQSSNFVTTVLLNERDLCTPLCLETVSRKLDLKNLVIW